jgi:8-oxo-dGTP pyrophosphatase MutT (NUDIX family)
MSGSRQGYTTRLPSQVAAVCYRRTRAGIEFLLVNTNGGGRWTFPKGCTDRRLSHSEAALREAWEEAGAVGEIAPHPFAVYVYVKGVFWKKPGVQEYAVKAFLMEVRHLRRAPEALRNPTWFAPVEAKKMLSRRRESKYGNELAAVIDRALERIPGFPPPPPGGSRSRAQLAY